MDKFFFKLSVPQHSLQDRSTKSFKRQATIEELKGVVVISDMEHAKVVLERNETSSDVKIKTLKELYKKKPCQEVLKKTQIGKIVHRLCKSSDPDVAIKAQEVYQLWKEHILGQVSRPSIEVQCDAKTQNMRSRGKELIVNAVKKCLKGTSLEDSLCLLDTSEKKDDTINLRSLSDHLEGEVYRSTKRNFDKSYQRTMRKIIFALTYQQKITEAIVKSEISVESLVKDYLKG